RPNRVERGTEVAPSFEQSPRPFARRRSRLQHTTRLDSDPRGPRSASSVFLVGVAMLAWLASGSALYAQTGRQLFVSPTGNDANAGTQLQPFRTIQHAADIVSAGDVVTVADGVYTGTCGTAIVCLSRGGSAGNPVTFRA